MSFFKVEVKKLSKIYPHSNADKLELAQVEGMTYQFAVPKGSYKAGDEVVYFPIDSILPQTFIQQENIANFLAGKEKNRVKTVTLRGEISQGYVAPVQRIKNYLSVAELPEDLSIAMSVIKYAPPEIRISTGNLVAMPDLVSVYDIEGCDNHPAIVEKLMNIPVVITEKMEGSNFFASINPDKKVSVGKRNNSIECLPDCPEHSYWTVARRDGILDALYKLADINPGHICTIRGEMLGTGIQGNYYRLKQLMVLIFDIQVDGKNISYTGLEALISQIGLEMKFVPVLSKDTTLKAWLGEKTIQQASNGISLLNPGLYPYLSDKDFDIREKEKGVKRLREGIVIKPMEEQYEVGFGRLFLKQRDPIYLDKTGN